MLFSGMRKGRWGWGDAIKSIFLPCCICPEIRRKHCWERAFGGLGGFHKPYIGLFSLCSHLPGFEKIKVHVGTLSSSLFLFFIAFVPKTLSSLNPSMGRRTRDWTFTSPWSLTEATQFLLPVASLPHRETIPVMRILGWCQRPKLKLTGPSELVNSKGLFISSKLMSVYTSDYF